VGVAVLVGVVLTIVRVLNRFHWVDLFDDLNFAIVPLIEVFFIWVACRIGKRIAYGPGAAKWAVPLSSAVILLAVETGLYWQVVVPQRAREDQEFRARMDKATEELFSGRR
jgi:hypothetical protein